MDDDSSLAWLSDVMWLLEADDEDAEADFSLFTEISGRTASSRSFSFFFDMTHPGKWGSRATRRDALDPSIANTQQISMPAAPCHPT